MSKIYKPLTDEQYWCLGNGKILKGEEAYEYLSKFSEYLENCSKQLETLTRNLQSVLDSYQPSDNIIVDVMKMEEMICTAMIYINMYEDNYKI